MDYDSIIVGTGQAGPPLAASLAGKGQKVAVIEKAHLGGSCINAGCTPTKSYVASARRAFVAKNSHSFGVKVNGSVSVDLKSVKERKDRIVTNSRSGLRSMLEGNDNITLIRGEATFVDEHTISVNGENHKASNIFINVGLRPSIPDGFEDIEYLTNETILQLEDVPEHLIIVGGGYIGLEFAQMFRRFGSRITILDRGDRLMKKEDTGFSDLVAEILNDEDVDIQLHTKIDTVKKEEGGKVSINAKNRKGDFSITGSHILLATGRIPNSDLLKLENAGVDTDEKGYIVVNDQLRSSVPHIWALGDCNGHGGFTHTAYNDYQIVYSQLHEAKKRSLSDRFVCYSVFVDPPFARVGMNKADIMKAGIKAKVASMPMDQISRAKEKGETRGILKMYIEAQSGKILGAAFLGVGADEYIHTIIDQMYAGQPYTVIRDAMHIHPTVSELLPTMLENLKDL